MIYIGSDHFGYELKQVLKDHLIAVDKEVVDLGVFDIENQADYPDIAREVSEKVLEHPNCFGVLVGKSGIGMMLAANKLTGARAVLVRDKETAVSAKECHDANIITLGITSEEKAKELLQVYIDTEYNPDENNVRCLKKLNPIKQKNND